LRWNDTIVEEGKVEGKKKEKENKGLVIEIFFFLVKNYFELVILFLNNLNLNLFGIFFYKNLKTNLLLLDIKQISTIRSNKING
jgi:hypothetical protein